MAYLYIIRGLPGSGKSTLAARMMDCGMVDVACEADDYFYVNGKYIFEASHLKEAHALCSKNVTTALRAGRVVSVSNTFRAVWEMKPYIDFCKTNKVGYTVIECQGDYGSIHAPREVRERMAARWERL